MRRDRHIDYRLHDVLNLMPRPKVLADVLRESCNFTQAVGPISLTWDKLNHSHFYTCQAIFEGLQILQFLKEDVGYDISDMLPLSAISILYYLSLIFSAKKSHY